MLSNAALQNFDRLNGTEKRSNEVNPHAPISPLRLPRIPAPQLKTSTDCRNVLHAQRLRHALEPDMVQRFLPDNIHRLMSPVAKSIWPMKPTHILHSDLCQTPDLRFNTQAFPECPMCICDAKKLDLSQRRMTSKSLHCSNRDTRNNALDQHDSPLFLCRVGRL